MLIEEANHRVGKAVLDDWNTNPTLASIDGCFGDKAPFWYYVLAEAQYEWVQRAKAGQGNAEPLKMGTVGARIVAETLIGMLWADGRSYLRQAPNRKPDSIRTMGDLIDFALS
ncbi:MAG: hypothetical protein ABI906_10880 [Pseudomonadota bacterium]